MATRGFHEVISSGTDRHYLKEIGWWLFGSVAGILLARWLSPLIPRDLIARGFKWIGIVFVVVGAVGALFNGIGYCSYLRKLARDERKRVRQEAASAREARRPLREAVRGFAEMLETSYGWVIEMDPLEAQRQALRWYEQIVSKWQQENEQWFELRKSDEWEEVLAELGTLSTRMLEIWKRRRALYQYSVAYSTEAMRAKEILQIEREIRHLQVHEARARVDFERQLRGQDEPEKAGRYLP